jgi:secreted PhoX family phosphatase
MSENGSMNRRSFLTNTAAVAGGVAIGAPFKALLANSRHSGGDWRNDRRERGRRSCSPDYGPLSPVKDQTTGLPLLYLPEGFEYLTFGWTGDLMSDGTATPGAHDGMATFRGRKGLIRLVRNHELDGAGAPFTNVAYDPRARGGTTTLEFDTREGTLVGSWASLSGTVRNCAGGTTPWGSWLTCEETTSGPGAPPDGLTEPHGYIFDVPAFGPTLPTALKAMGRFSHEAVALDPDTGIVYETEDATPGGFYRFVPNTRGDLSAGGALEMLAIEGSPNYNTGVGQVPEEPLDVVWVPIASPDPIAGQPRVYAQGALLGGAAFVKLEGAWWSRGKAYFVSSSGGNAGQGQIWEYEPCSETLTMIFESPAAEVLNAPDNICASPRGGFILCEDGSGTEFLHGLTVDGNIFRFAQNNVDLRAPNSSHGFASDYRGSEFAGAAYSPDGRWLFVNVQSPGITFAITGPWRNGAL